MQLDIANGVCVSNQTGKSIIRVLEYDFIELEQQTLQSSIT